MPILRRTLIAVTLAPFLPTAIAQADAQKVDAPNFIAIHPRLATSGQPTAHALTTLGSHGFQAVVYLAPSTVSNAVKNEPELLAEQNITFIHIPIPFGAPEASHVMALFDALDSLQDRKVLIHCEINMRASAMVFLYRVIQRKETPAVAYEAVARVWSPRGVWRSLITEQLALNHIPFELY